MNNPISKKEILKKLSKEELLGLCMALKYDFYEITGRQSLICIEKGEAKKMFNAFDVMNTDEPVDDEVFDICFKVVKV